jgi:hypothetical protein
MAQIQTTPVAGTSTETTYPGEVPQGTTVPLDSAEAGVTPVPGERLAKDQNNNVFDMQDPNNPRKVGQLDASGHLQRDNANATTTPSPEAAPPAAPAAAPGAAAPATAPSIAETNPPPGDGKVPAGALHELETGTQVDGTQRQGEVLQVDENNEVFDMADPNNPKHVGTMQRSDPSQPPHVVRNDSNTAQPASVPM